MGEGLKRYELLIYKIHKLYGYMVQLVYSQYFIIIIHGI